MEGSSNLFDLISKILEIDGLGDNTDTKSYDPKKDEFEKISVYDFFNHIFDSYNKFMNNVDDNDNNNIIITNTEPTEIPKWAKVTPSN